MSENSYKNAGVDIDAGNEAVRRIADRVRATFTHAVLRGIGTFGSMCDLTDLLAGYRKPVLIQSIDGVGTKVTVAGMAGRFRGLGFDVVSATVNDILVHGARPVTFLDYIANEKLDPAVVEEIVAGMCEACLECGVPLVGGETAEMPSTYRPGEHDVVGCVTGLVERDAIITGDAIVEGDTVLGLASTGLHTNGYSLARHLLFKVGGYTVTDTPAALGESVADALLRTHRNYAPAVYALLEAAVPVHGMAHITGGGFLENIPRVLPEGLSAIIERDAWPRPPIFPFLAELGGLADAELFRTFNMGIGYVVMLPSDAAAAALQLLAGIGFDAFTIGVIGRESERVVLR